MYGWGYSIRLIYCLIGWLQGGVQLLTITSTPDAAYEICKKYSPECDTPIGGLAGDTRDEENEEGEGERGEEEEEEEEEDEVEEEDEDNYDTQYQVNSTFDPLVVTQIYQHNSSYVSNCLLMWTDLLISKCFPWAILINSALII